MQAEHKSGHALVGCASRKLACGGSDQEALNDERVTNADGYGTAPEATVTTKDLAEPSGHHPNLSFAANVRYGSWPCKNAWAEALSPGGDGRVQ